MTDAASFDDLNADERAAYRGAQTRRDQNRILRLAMRRIEAEEREAGLPPRPKPLPSLPPVRKAIV